MDVPWTAEQLNSPETMLDFLAHSSLFEGLESRLLEWLSHQAIVMTFAAPHCASTISFMPPAFPTDSRSITS